MHDEPASEIRLKNNLDWTFFNVFKRRYSAKACQKTGGKRRLVDMWPIVDNRLAKYCAIVSSGRNIFIVFKFAIEKSKDLGCC
jgi:hypothetical protein